MSLQDEIDARSTEIKSDSYSMSIGELANLYQDQEIDIHPEFQRFYRWSSLQKTKLSCSCAVRGSKWGRLAAPVARWGNSARG